MTSKKISILMAIVLFLGVSVLVVEANNKWGKYHWNLSTTDTETNPLLIGDNLSVVWTSSLTTASADANLSVLKNAVVAGSNINCDPTNGRIEVCNGEYGDNDWLGIASIWIKRGRSGHITQGVVKVNDTYFSSSTLPYNTQAWRDFVMCQEINHEFGLDHQDENLTNPNLGTCMDYTNDPDGTIFNQFDNRLLNDHDREQMTTIYAHLNETSDGGNDGGKPSKCTPWPSCNKKNQASAGANIDLNDPSSWGQAIRQDAQGKNSLFRRVLPNGQILITHVIWVE